MIKKFPSSFQKFFVGCFKLHFTNPQRKLWWQTNSVKNLCSSKSFSDVEPKNCGFLLRNFYRDCQNCKLSVQLTTFILTFWLLTRKLQPFVMASSQNFISTFPQVWWKQKLEKIFSFLSVLKIEPQILGLLTKIVLRISKYCFLLAHRMILWKKSSPGKVIVSFKQFAFSDIEREQLAFCRKLFVWFLKTATFVT